MRAGRPPASRDGGEDDAAQHRDPEDQRADQRVAAHQQQHPQQHRKCEHADS
jgi:hypothetical protein